MMLKKHKNIVMDIRYLTISICTLMLLLMLLTYGLVRITYRVSDLETTVQYLTETPNRKVLTTI